MKRISKWIPIWVALFFVFYVAAGALRGTDDGAGGTTVSPWVLVALPFVAFPVLFAFFLRRNLRQLAAFEMRPLAGDAVSAEFRARVADLEALGFRALGSPVATEGSFQLRIQPLLAPDQRSYAAVFEHGTKRLVAFDFDSRLCDGRLVTTSSSALAARAPHRSDLLIQVFPSASPAELFKRHQEALESLGSFGEPLGARSEDYVDLCRESYRRQLAGVRAVEFVGLLLGGKSVHLTPIAGRPK